MRRIRFSHKRNRGCWGKAYCDEWRMKIQCGDKSEGSIYAGRTV